MRDITVLVSKKYFIGKSECHPLFWKGRFGYGKECAVRDKYFVQKKYLVHADGQGKFYIEISSAKKFKTILLRKQMSKSKVIFKLVSCWKVA